MLFCETEQLCEVFKRITSGKPSADSETGKKTADKHSPAGLKLVTVKDIKTTVNNQQQKIQLAPGGIVTPLAQDLAKEHAITIVRAGN
jgi:hypothetical protein